MLLRTARAKARVDRTIEPRLRRMLVAMLDPRPERRPTAAALAGGAAGTHPIPLLVRRHRTAFAAGVAAVAVLVVAGVVLTGRGGDGGELVATTTAPATAPTSTDPPCQPLPYQPCGQPAAPYTDGRRCIDDHADYDGLAANGCEAAPDTVDGTDLVERISANIVPADDVDRYPVHISDAGDLLCNNTFHLRLVAPDGLALLLELYDGGGELVDRATSADGVAGEITVSDPRCFRSDEADYVAEVRPSGSDRTAADYVLTREGSF